MNQILLSTINKDELIKELLSGVQEIIKSSNKEPKNKEFLTRKEVADLFQVSLVTIHKWTKIGILTKHQIGGRIYFKYAEVISALKKIERVI